MDQRISVYLNVIIVIRDAYIMHDYVSQCNYCYKRCLAKKRKVGIEIKKKW